MMIISILIHFYATFLSYLFQYFQPLIRIYNEIIQVLSDYISETIKDKRSVQDIMKGYYFASLHWALDHKTGFRILRQFNSSPYLNKIAEEEIQKHIQPVLDLLEKGIKDKIIKPMDVDILFTLISGHTFSINQYLVKKNLSKAKQDKVIVDTFDLLWGMIT